MKKVLFVCIENAGRSQMAEAFANKYGKDKLAASSAGNKPADKINPIVVDAMKEKGFRPFRKQAQTPNLPNGPRT